MGKLVVRVDDIHPQMQWDRFDGFVAEMTKRGLTGLLGVIPDCRDKSLQKDKARPDFWDVIRQLSDQGWVVAQHGFTHVYDSDAPNLVKSKHTSEFAGHDYETQRARLAKGKAKLEEHGIRSDVFMAPGHTFDTVTLDALRDTGFKSVTDGYGLWPYEQRGLTLVPQLVSGPHGAPVGVFTTCIHLWSVKPADIPALVERCAEHDVIDFREAAKMRGPAVLAPAARALTQTALTWMRRRRKPRD